MLLIIHTKREIILAWLAVCAKGGMEQVDQRLWVGAGGTEFAERSAGRASDPVAVSSAFVWTKPIKKFHTQIISHLTYK